jgi:hypothetical protein
VPSAGSPGNAQDCTVGGAGDLVLALWEDDRTTPKSLMRARSTDGGLSWEPASGFAGQDPLEHGQDSSVHVDPAGRIVLGLQSAYAVYAALSDDNGVTFASPRQVGPGLFLHLGGTRHGELFATWEHFEASAGDPNAAKNDAAKRIGMACSADALATLEGPFLVPGSDATFGRTYAACIVGDDVVDVVSVDKAAGGGLRHRRATIVR